jgi:hypothetical protein
MNPATCMRAALVLCGSVRRACRLVIALYGFDESAMREVARMEVRS